MLRAVLEPRALVGVDARRGRRRRPGGRGHARDLGVGRGAAPVSTGAGAAPRRRPRRARWCRPGRAGPDDVALGGSAGRGVDAAAARRPVHVPGRRRAAGARARRGPACRSSAAWRRPRAGPGGNRLVADDRVLDRGAVGVLLGPARRRRAVVAQGCRPVGQPYVVTAVDGNHVVALGGRPALERLEELAALDERGGPGAAAARPARRPRRRRAPGRVRPGRLPRPQRARRPRGRRRARRRRDGRGRPDAAVPDPRRPAPPTSTCARALAGPDRGRLAALHLHRPRPAAVRPTRPRRDGRCATRSARSRSRAGSAPASSGRSAATTTSTASPPASPSSTDRTHRRSARRRPGAARGDPLGSSGGGTERRRRRRPGR